jgi:hypothetical protein
VDGREIARRRLYGQHLAGTPLADPVAVVRHFGAMQAQDYPVARWSVGQRCSAAGDTDVRTAVDDGSIVRLHGLRPTWHFVAGVDAAWIQALIAPRVHAVNAFYYRQHGMDEATGSRTTRAISDVLRGGNHLTRAEIGAALAAKGIDAAGNRLAYLVMRCELEGLVVNGPMRGHQHTYALLDERVSGPLVLDPDEALAELTRRYFTSHGPATVKDFAWWSSLTVSQVRRGLSMVDLEHSDVDGRRYWFVPGDPPPPSPSPDVQILQAYDEYVVAYTESRELINLAGLDLGTGSPNLLVHAILLDGQVIGVWRRVVDRGRIVVQPRVAIRLTTRLRTAIDAGFARYAVFAGVPVEIQWTA